MDISVNWLRALLPGLEGDPQELAERISLTAMPVDRVVPVGEDLEGIIVARVLETRSHPNADRLTLCKVDAGDEEPIDVVCGAPNVVEGAFYPYVPPGSELPGGFRIESRKIRGEMSHGMLCSEKELGLGRDAGGILRLEGDFAPGQGFAEALELPDARLELDLTPNRIDLACHVGVARELSSHGSGEISLSEFAGAEWRPRWVDGEGEAESGGVRIVVEDSQRCPRYLGAIVRGVRIAPSPAWLQARLRGAGARPINNVVDATNFVLLEQNQPLHAFDLSAVGDEVRVRSAREGEALRTLDGEEHVLDAAATVIADASRPIALAGVMGGEESEVSANTIDLLIECAAFDPAHTRHTAASTGLSTDASYRFERGIDETGQEAALTRCVELILAIAGGEADTRAIRVGGPPAAPAIVPLRLSRARQVLGLELDRERVELLLAPLGFAFPESDATGNEILVRVPGWRRDVSNEVDLLEEIARRHGYDAFPDEPRRFRPSSVPDTPDRERETVIRTVLAAEGLQEARSLSFVPEDRSSQSRVALLKPLSRSEGFLRTDLVPVLLGRLEHNWSRGHGDIRLFELGTVFQTRDPRPEPVGPGATPTERDAAMPFSEERRFAFVVTGSRLPGHWSGQPEPFDVWDLRGLVETLVRKLVMGHIEPLEPASAQALDAGSRGSRPGFGFESWLSEEALAIGSGDFLAGVAGRVKAAAIDAPPWAGPVYAGEFRFEAVHTDDSRRYTPLPQFPSVLRDLAFTLDSAVSASTAEEAIRDAAPPILSELHMFDVYEGEAVESGRRSLAWRLLFRAADRTLTDGEVDQAMSVIIRRLEEDLDVRIRAS